MRRELLACLVLLTCGCPRPVCEAGRTVSCPCLDAPVGAQTCRENGEGWNPCECPAAPDAGSADGGTDAGEPRDAGAPDAGEQGDGGQSVVGSPCVFPDPFSAAAPTSGFCLEGAAVACDFASRTLVRTECAPEEACREVAVQQVGLDYTRPPMPEHLYSWASCVPRDAETCTFRFDESLTYWVSVTGLYTRCDGSGVVQVCRMSLPSPSLAQPFPANAGNPDGYWESSPCASDETCREQRVGESACTVGETRCSAYASSCESDSTLLACDEESYPVRVRCDSGGICRSDCSGWASCYPLDLVEDPGLCAAGTPDRCSPDQTAVLFCNQSCFERGDGCFCKQTGSVCSDGTVCLERSYRDGTTGVECGFDIDCSAGSRCEGAAAILCRDWGERIDCGALGMDCAAQDGAVGCVAGESSCSVSEPAGCLDDATVDLCCPEDGEAFVGTGSYPCVPGRRFTLRCPTTPVGSYSCRDGECQWAGR